MVDTRLEELPEGFRVVDPARLPHPEEPVRGYPQPADHEFRLIATGAVERTIRPSFTTARERVKEALESAEQVVNELRESLERRFDAAIDAVMEEGRVGARPSQDPKKGRPSVEIADAALESAHTALSELLGELQAACVEITTAVRGDLDALVGRLDTQLASANPLEARLQAKRAQVELQGTAALRLTVARLRRRARALLERFGLHSDEETAEGGAPLEAAGSPGADHVLLAEEV
jgi:hypothetical protein